MPVVNVVIFIVQLNNDIGVSVIKFAIVVRILGDRLKLLNSINFNWLFASSSEEGIRLLAKLCHILSDLFSIQGLGFNHWNIFINDQSS